jgi:hypothetical protein
MSFKDDYKTQTGRKQAKLAKIILRKHEKIRKILWCWENFSMILIVAWHTAQAYFAHSATELRFLPLLFAFHTAMEAPPLWHDAFSNQINRLMILGEHRHGELR